MPFSESVLVEELRQPFFSPSANTNTKQHVEYGYITNIND